MKLLLSTLTLCVLLNVISGQSGYGKHVTVPTKQLNDGNHMPTFGLETFGFNDPKVREAVNRAIEAGYHHIEAAALHKKEKEIAKGVIEVLKKGLVKNEEHFVTPKLRNDNNAHDQVVPALRESLAKLGVEFVGLHLIQSPLASNKDGSPAIIDYLETWQGTEDAKELGLAKPIGLLNFNTEKIDRITANSNIVPAVKQIEIHPSKTEEKTVRESFDRSIPVTAFSPFEIYTATGESLSKDDPKIVAIAKKYNKSVNQIFLQYVLDRNLITNPKSTNQNIDLFGFHLTPEEIATISSLKTITSIVNYGK